MNIVPADSQPEIEAMVSNDGVGFVRAVQAVDIKVDTFNVSKYELIHGAVLNISQDAIAVGDARRDFEMMSGSRGSSAHSESIRGDNRAPVCAAHLSLDTIQIPVDGRLLHLAPGMAVTVEIKTGKRRVIGYLVSPVLRYKEEALRER